MRKPFTYSLSDNDVLTIISVLTVMVNELPDSDLVSPEIISQALYYSDQALETLSNGGNQISNNQLSAIHMALQLADGIISGQVPASNDSIELCKNSLFSIRKLLSVFDKYFSN
jgi:hypothetical protein